MVKKINKKTRAELQKQTKKDMKISRKEDSLNCRKKALTLIEAVKKDIDVINQAKHHVNNQLKSLNDKELKSKGALQILELLLEENKK